MTLGVRLVEQRNIGAEPVIAARRVFGLLHPAVANNRMEDALKLTSFCRIGKDNLTEAYTIRAAIRPDHLRSEGFLNGFLHSGVTGEQLMHAAVSVKEIGTQMAA